ncbi:MAG: hypothetical protein C6W58_09500 [Bacillaceae bacterium]|uniref:Uncharacterized protein n=1 Tax=Aeribacillus pallidus TaxID=33936 RepID=A0A165X6T7_9BACI|nr:hypothetical protein CX649_09595 [Bacillaceae bacterium ZC4]KZM58001.1 hypothetical protein A3Q35_00565 [Aeribacillus pallidus]REJ16716.1 MAG: hypothetical protein C6W58_09500 [Bacillaceae bacterium]KZN95693.1 hypothetical protein AZI98_11480 [Aeribacillus pallidus]REJ24051.1 MAG: hypothetical protein C6W54_07990 [Bacillaceae bacterium]
MLLAFFTKEEKLISQDQKITFEIATIPDLPLLARREKPGGIFHEYTPRSNFMTGGERNENHLSDHSKANIDGKQQGKTDS